MTWATSFDQSGLMHHTVSSASFNYCLHLQNIRLCNVISQGLKGLSRSVTFHLRLVCVSVAWQHRLTQRRAQNCTSLRLKICCLDLPCEADERVIAIEINHSCGTEVECKEFEISYARCCHISPFETAKLLALAHSTAPASPSCRDQMYRTTSHWSMVSATIQLRRCRRRWVIQAFASSKG